MPPILNIGVLAHVDAGKTSLTERILFETGTIAQPGRVDAGTTRTDSLALEQQRGITIRAAVASAMWRDFQINLVDTPGHPDFIAEVERSLSVLDAVVLVVSAVEGVQPQTRRLARAIRGLGLPTLIFVNKIDRTGARHTSLLQEIESQLGWDILPLVAPVDIGTHDAAIRPLSLTADGVVERLALHDDALLASWLDGTVGREQVESAISHALGSGAVVPLLFGSAITGVGVPELLDAITTYRKPAAPAGDALSAQAFKVERQDERVVWLRIHQGELHTRAESPAGKVTRLQLSTPAGLELVQHAGAGDIVLAHGLPGLRVGEFVGQPRPHGPQQFVPVFETVVRENRPEDRHRLHEALIELADQDPFISLRHDTQAGVTSVRLFGDVQKEVIAFDLHSQYGIEATFADSTVVCIERLRGEAAATELMLAAGNPFLAGVGLAIAPMPPGAGVTYRRQQQSLGKLPPAMYVGIEETIYSALREGVYGWEITDIHVELTFVEYSSPSSTVSDFRNLVPLVLATAITEAGADVCEPILRFRLAVPEDLLAEAVRLLMQRRGVIAESTIVANEAVLTGTIPAAEIAAFERHLPGISRGQGDLDYWQHEWQPIADAPPHRIRTASNPFDRAAYLTRLSGRM